MAVDNVKNRSQAVVPPATPAAPPPPPPANAPAAAVDGFDSGGAPASTTAAADPAPAIIGAPTFRVAWGGHLVPVEDPKTTKATDDKDAPRTDGPPVEDGTAQAEEWPPGVSNADAAALAELGISPADLTEGAAAVPHLLAAAEAARAGDVDATLRHLADAAAVAPGLVQKGIAALTSKLPDGDLKTLLNDPALPALLGQIATGDWPGAAQTLAENPALVTAAGDAIANLPQVKALLDAAGIDPSQLPDLGAVLPDLIALGGAVASGDAEAATRAALSLGSKLDADAFGGLYAKLAEHLPPAVRDFLDSVVSNPQFQAFASELLKDPSLPEVVEKLVAGDLPGAGRLLASNEALVAAGAELLGEIPAVKEFLTQTLGITAEQLPELAGALPDLLKAAALLSSGDPEKIGEAIDLIAQAASQAPGAGAAMLAHAAAGLPDTHPAKAILTDQALMKEVLEQAPEVLDALQSGDLPGALAKLSDVLGDAELQAALAANPAVQNLLASLGITDPAAQQEALAVLPDLLQLGSALAQNPIPWDQVLATVQKIAQDAPNALLAVGQQLAARIPEGSQPAWLKPLLGDPAVLTALTQHPEAFQQLFSGDPEQMATGLATLLADPTVSQAVASALLATDAGRLIGEHLGITDPTQLATLLQVAPDLVALGQAVRDGNIEAAMAALGHALGHLQAKDPALLAQLIDTVGTKLNLPENVRVLLADPAFHSLLANGDAQAAIAALARQDFDTFLAHLPGALAAIPGGEAGLLEKLGLPSWLAGLTGATATALQNPEVRGALKELFDAIGAQDVEGMARAVGKLGGLLVDPAKVPPDVAIAMLDALGHLPGGIGKLFQNHDLNEALVRSGTLSHLFQAADCLFHGDITGAMQALGGAAEALLTYAKPGEQPIEIAGLDLPVTESGLKAFGALFNQLYEALPNGVKQRIRDAVMDIAGAAGSWIPIIGDAVAIGTDAYDLATADDNTERLIAGGQLALDIVGLFQVTKPLTGPLKFGLALARVLSTANDLVGAVDEFQSVFAGFTTEPPLPPVSEELMAEYGVDQATLDAVIAAHPELEKDPVALTTLIRAAQAAQVPPAQFGAFVDAIERSFTGQGTPPLSAAVEHLTNTLAGGNTQESEANDIRNWLRANAPEAAAFSTVLTAEELGDPDAYGLTQEQKDWLAATYGIDVSTGEYDWTQLEALVAAAQAYGVQPQDFQAFVTALAQASEAQGIPLSGLAYALASKLGATWGYGVTGEGGRIGDAQAVVEDLRVSIGNSVPGFQWPPPAPA